MLSINEQYKIELLKKSLKKRSLILKFRGTSMQPALIEGMKIRAKHLDKLKNNLKAGDLIIFLRENVLGCHRLILFKKDKFMKNQYYLKGDAKLVPDNIMPAESIIGKVIEVRNTDNHKIPLPKFSLTKLFIIQQYVLLYFILRKMLSVKWVNILLRKPLIAIIKFFD